MIRWRENISKNEQTSGISREIPISELIDNDFKYRVLGSFYCKPIESETLGLEPKNLHFKKIHVCFICTLSLNRSPLGRNLSRKPFHQGRLCCPSRDYFVGIWLLIQLGWAQGTYLKSFKSCKVRSLMSAADQLLDLIYFGSYQGKKGTELMVRLLVISSKWLTWNDVLLFKNKVKTSISVFSCLKDYSNELIMLVK